MRYKSHLLGSFIIQSWKIETLPASLNFEINNVARTVPLEDIVDITTSGFIWKKLTLHLKDKEYEFKGLSGRKAKVIKRDIRSLFHAKVLGALTRAPHAFEDAQDKSQQLLSIPQYISYFLHNKWRDSLHTAVISTLHPLFSAAALRDDQKKYYDLIHQFSQPDNESIKQHNETFIEQTQIKCKDLFDILEAFPLSEEQQRAVIIDADRQLLIAAAGSGKSATIAAKAVYLIDQGLASSDEILVLAYNKDAQKEIQERLQSRLGITPKYTTPVTAKTFHSLGLEIIKTHSERKPSIAEIATAGKNRQLQIFNGLIESLLKRDKAFARDWSLFNLLYLNPMKSIASFKSKDLSQDRKRLILSLLNQNEEAHLFGVGDDWQSIYRFSGADIDLMISFSEHFGRSVETYLTKTYRSYQGIVDTASRFIMKNPEQISKSVTALNDIDACQVNIINYENQQDSEIGNLLDQLEKTAIDNNTRLTVFLLGRYNFLKPVNMAALIYRYDHITLSFKTIHASKGLEADYVIILNLEAGKFGFPSTIDDDPLLELVIPKPEHYPHAEERRLMYVAITRAKRGAFLLSNTRKPSIFTNELLTILKS